MIIFNQRFVTRSFGACWTFRKKPPATGNTWYSPNQGLLQIGGQNSYSYKDSHTLSAKESGLLWTFRTSYPVQHSLPSILNNHQYSQSFSHPSPTPLLPSTCRITLTSPMTPSSTTTPTVPTKITQPVAQQCPPADPPPTTRTQGYSKTLPAPNPTGSNSSSSATAKKRLQNASILACRIAVTLISKKRIIHWGTCFASMWGRTLRWSLMGIGCRILWLRRCSIFPFLVLSLYRPLSPTLLYSFLFTPTLIIKENNLDC